MPMRRWSVLQRLAGVGWVAAVLACAAAGPSTPWAVERAGQLRGEAKPEAALRMTDREIARSHPGPSRRLVELHTAILRDLDRHTEADAYESFGQRYFAGEPTDRTGHELSQRNCSRRQPGFQLIHSWGRPQRGGWEIGAVVATFEIDEGGSIGAIEVHSARDPASAWAAIDAIANARIHDRRLAELRSEAPERFPIALCLWRDFDPRSDPIPRDARIRGGR